MVNLRAPQVKVLEHFLSAGVTLNLTGEGNDYVGKGLSGGKIIIKPFQ